MIALALTSALALVAVCVSQRAAHAVIVRDARRKAWLEGYRRAATHKFNVSKQTQQTKGN